LNGDESGGHIIIKIKTQFGLFPSDVVHITGSDYSASKAN